MIALTSIQMAAGIAALVVAVVVFAAVIVCAMLGTVGDEW